VLDLATQANGTNCLLLTYHADDVVIAVGERGVEPTLVTADTLLQLPSLLEPILHRRLWVGEVDWVLDGIHAPSEDVVYGFTQLLCDVRVRVDTEAHTTLGDEDKAAAFLGEGPHLLLGG
jgi:hypothetical protein